MDKINDYKKLVEKELIYQASKSLYDAPDVHRHLVISQDKVDFMVLSMGWYKNRFLHTIIFHLQVKDNKIWIMKNNTNVLIDRCLMEQGIPFKDIEVGFLSEDSRAERQQIMFVE